MDLDPREREYVRVSRAHGGLIRKHLAEQAKLDLSEERYLQELGQIKSTIMHAISDRWDARLSTLFYVLMERFPDMYLAEDELERTILNRQDAGKISVTALEQRDRFVYSNST
ncbi:hypothetical protein F5Y10DRAFT_245294 [Nemania abortiva]|nr:hypothetical protein F5Y10DRAFT_245294 [Nemania abortiva]